MHEKGMHEKVSEKSLLLKMRADPSATLFLLEVHIILFRFIHRFYNFLQNSRFLLEHPEEQRDLRMRDKFYTDNWR